MAMDFEVRLTAEFSEWLDELNDRIALDAISARLARMQIGGFGDHASVGGGVSELRIHYGPGFRAYYTVRGRVIVVMLMGGTKRTQDRDIERAKRIAKEV